MHAMHDRSGFDDALAIWDMRHADGVAVHGDVTLGVALEGEERAASLARGGNGRVARIQGGWMSVGDDALSLAGPEMTLCMRLKNTSGDWDAPLFAKEDPDDPYGVILSAGDGRLQYLWRTTPASERTTSLQSDTADYLDGVMRLYAPIDMIGAEGWHDIVMRFCGVNLELFIDGVQLDQDWPHGNLHAFHGPFLIGAGWQEGRIASGFEGMLDHVVLWNRALGDDEIAELSGGAEAIARREIEILGKPLAVPQYWHPRGHNTSAGDCMLFTNRGRLHLFWLFDRRHHGSKWGRGAHEWAHWSTADLVHWEKHPRALTLTHPWEVAHGTGSLIEYEGKIYAYYAEFSAWGNFKDSPYKELSICMAESDDGIHFTKTGKIEPRGFDSHTMRDPETGLYHLLTPGSGQQWPTNWPDGKNGLLDYTATDPVRGPWTLQPKHFHEAFGNCPHVFSWNGWHYLWMENRFWMSGHLMGPWQEHTPAKLIPLHVPKSELFMDGRAFVAGILTDQGWGGDIVFHELIQYADGTLGEKFAPEMIPPCGDPLTLTQDGDTFSGLPGNARVRISLQPNDSSSPFAIRLRSSDAPNSGFPFSFDPVHRTAAFVHPEGARTDAAPFTETDALNAFDGPLKLDIIMVGDIFDICINASRTIIARCKGLTGDRLVLDGCSPVDIDVRPLKPPRTRT